MKRKLLIAATLLPLTLLPLAGWAQDLAYNLPRTTLTLEVTIERSCTFAGPYARYAEKFLGISVPTEDAVTHRITAMRMTSALEADPAASFSLSEKAAKMAAADYLEMTALGLVAQAEDRSFPDEVRWNFQGVSSEGDFSGKGVSFNLESRSAVLYPAAEDGSRYNSISVQQRMTVAKSLEERAREAAERIGELRDNRLDILTGNTDVSFSGEALGDAVRALEALEAEYLTLFTGYSTSETQTLSFDLVPGGGKGRSVQVAFRLSDEAGLLPAEDLSGQLYMLEITPETDGVEDDAEDPSFKGEYLRYRIPAVCRIRITDGVRTYLQTRLPVCQKGKTALKPLKKKSSLF